MERQDLPTKTIQFDKQVKVFEDIVTHTYLHNLSECEINLPSEQRDTSVRWYKINKMVLDKDVFFVDALSMLYTSLHSCAKNVVLVIEKLSEQELNIYLGARDFSGINNISGEILRSGLHGYLPGVKVDVVPRIKKQDYERTYVSEVSALASLFDDKKESFVQGIERLINATSFVPKFTAYFIADNISESEANSMIYAFNELRNCLVPLAETQVTFSKSHSDGVTESLSKNISNTITRSLSQTITQSENFTDGVTHSSSKSGGKSDNRNRNLLTATWNTVFGGKMGSSSNEGWAEQEGTQQTHGTGTARANQTGQSDARQIGQQEQHGTNRSDSQGISTQFTYKNGHVQHYLDVIESQIERISSGIPLGLWSVATYFVAPSKTTAIELANLYRGCIVGEDSNLESCAINVWEDANNTALITKWLDKTKQPRFNYNGMNISAGVVVTSKELAIQFSLPQSSVPGLLVREEKTFGRTVSNSQNLGNDNSIKIGSILHLGQEFDEEVRLSIDGLSKHTLVTGTTGSGKSNTLYLLISELKKRSKTFLIIEPAKGEYKKVFGGYPDVYVYGTNPQFSEILCINPFEFPDRISVEEHIESLVEIFNACWPMYAAMPQALKHSIINAYKNCGWDLSESSNPNGIYPTVEDVIDALREYINSSEYSAETKADYKGSLETRLQSLHEGIIGRMLNSNSPIPDELLFNRNVIIDLSRLKSSESKSLIMGLLIMKLDEYRASENKGLNLPLRHVTILEEAHNLLKRTSTVQSSESANLAGMAVERIANSMAEMRTYGEGFIIVDQSPSMLDFAAIRNTNTKILMQLPDNDDRDHTGRAVGLQEQQVLEISRLKTGEAIVYQSGWEEAVKSKISFYDYQHNEKWSFKRSVKPISHKRDEVFNILLCGFTSTQQIALSANLKDAILKTSISGKSKASILSAIRSRYRLTPELCAQVLVELVGVNLFKEIMKHNDFKVMNAILKRGIHDILPMEQLRNVEVFENMYILGCSSLHHKHFYNKWIYLKSINK